MRSQASSRFRPDWDRWNYTAALALCGASAGGFAVVINLLGRTPGFLEPIRLDAPEAVFIYGAGFATGAALAALIAYWAHGGTRQFGSGRNNLQPLQWSALAVGYAIFYPLLIGALFLPFALLFLSVYTDLIQPADLFYASADTIMLAPLRGLATGAPFIFAGMWASLLFGVGAALIDRVSTLPHPRSGQYLWAVSVALAALITLAAALVPASTLAKLG
ncbi:MAG: hypothetical protein O3A47_13400 [Chloroflexi bacterium]|nr:hypothetical protein [Chloroflexota bacterium]